MAEDWEIPTPQSTGATGWQTAAAVTAPEMTAAYALRPLSTGEILDRTFSVYRSHFWLFAGLTSIAGVWGLILNLVQLLIRHSVQIHHGFRAVLWETQGAGVVMPILTLPVSSLVYAASVLALCEVYLGREADVQSSLRVTAKHWLRYVGVSVWWGFSALWVFVLLFVPVAVIAFVPKFVSYALLAGLVLFVSVVLGGVYGVIAYIRNSLAIPAAVMEDTGVRRSMRRSKTLAAGTKGRIFVVLLIAVALYFVVGAIESPLLFLVARNPLQEHFIAQAVILGISFLGSTLISPVALIGLTLVYFDQRVRKEAFDILMQLGPAPVPADSMGTGVWPAVAGLEPAAEAAVTTSVESAPLPAVGISAAPISVEPIATEPILAPMDEPARPRTDDETLP